MAFLIVATQEQSELDRLVRDLGGGPAERREEALEALVSFGEKTLPTLREALKAAEPELRQRAKEAIDIIERMKVERKHDDERRSGLLLTSTKARDQERPKETNIGWAESVRFSIARTPFKGGAILLATPKNYLFRKSLSPDFKVMSGGDLSWDVVGVTDDAGRDCPVERCGSCSPGLTYVPGARGPLHVRLRGKILWFSSYDLEFQNPKDGDAQSVGNFRVEVAWPNLKVTSRRPFSQAVFEETGNAFRYERKTGESPGLGANGLEGTVGTLGADRLATDRASWCRCKDGPTRAEEKPKPVMVSERTVTSIAADKLRVTDVARIRFTFRKPIEDAFDLTVDVATE